MAFDAGALAERLQELQASYGTPGRYTVAISGGLDSVVLLHALSRTATTLPIRALHINHGLDPQSAVWDTQTHDLARQLDVDYQSVAVEVDAEHPGGPEASAREARYAVFQTELGAGDWLLCAHHRDDQAETLLLNLLRGSGPLGLAAMPAGRRLGQGWLIRPLLDTAREELAAYSERCGLSFIEDPSNGDTAFDRNYLRHEVMPRLKRRWPSASAGLARSARLSAEAQAVLDSLAAEDADRLATSAANRLSVPALEKLSDPRQRNALRFLCRRLNLPLPPAGRLKHILQVPAAAIDAQPLVTWSNVELRRYRDELFLLPVLPSVPGESRRLSIDSPVELGEGLGRLELQATTAAGISADVAKRGLDVRYRQGGERLRPTEGSRSQRLKVLLQSAGVLPWMRDRIPLLEASGKLVAAGDLWTEAAFTATPGYKLVWHDRPALF